MTAFATYQNLATRMKRTFTTEEQAWVTSLLEDAADLMRGVMRNRVYPSTTSTYIAYPVGGRVALPQSFIRTVDAVARDGVAVTFTRYQDTVLVDSDEAVDITFTYGLATAPGDLLGINCAMVSGAMLTVEAGLGLTAGGLSSVALDDFKAAWADAGAASGMALTTATQTYLEDHYGTTSWIVEASR
jgi:hypothetical protein